MKIFYHFTLLILAGGLVLGCQDSAGVEDLPPMLPESTFPVDPINDYIPRGYQARVAWPNDAAPNGRIWIKGSERYPRCRIGDRTFDLGEKNSTGEGDSDAYLLTVAYRFGNVLHH